ncbi:hypothetical protein [Marinobacter sp. ATCH36]|uniref:hypothetical protein n=1 Tax=Marinobacter sp. ATCH36 TaxID=2945106 RepID=UPI0020229180|nr:hypothetical protein [Marinobacter sp. ATCH36]MCL7943666.1 hypothetical protein [Marinobacter sp. ATCH36]
MRKTTLSDPKKTGTDLFLITIRATGPIMHVDKAKKRIAKQVKKGFHGNPLISLKYFGKEHFGKTPDSATQVVVSFTEGKGADAKTVIEIDGISTLNEN